MRKILILLLMSVTGIYNDTGEGTKYADIPCDIKIKKPVPGSQWMSEAQLILISKQS